MINFPCRLMVASWLKYIWYFSVIICHKYVRKNVVHFHNWLLKILFFFLHLDECQII
jgi:hypothetical protein